MIEEILKYLSVYALSGFKFIFGPTLGASYGFSLVVSALLTACGMMTTVYIFTYFGEHLRGLLNRFKKKDRKVFTKRNRQFVRIWGKYGVKGIALVTPLLLMPIGGAILVNALGGKRREIILWMWISALGHAFIQTWMFREGLQLIKSFF